MRSSLFESFRGKQALPLSQAQQDLQAASGIRRRLSSLSLDLKMNMKNVQSSPAWAFRRSKSVSSMGEYAGTSIRKWWDWGWTWILSRKPTFAKDLEMNQEETTTVSWGHVFYKVRSQLRRLMRSDNVVLPQTFRYDSYNYSKNFDNRERVLVSH